MAGGHPPSPHPSIPFLTSVLHTSAVQRSLDSLRRLLAEEIPLADRLGVTVAAAGEGWVVLAAPLEFNRNHEGTAFGGSLNAVATLAGWSAVWWSLEEAAVSGVVVIQDSAVRFRRPVTGDFQATASLDPDRVARLIEAVARKGKGRITVDVTVGDADGPAVEFAGRYVVTR